MSPRKRPDLTKAYPVSNWETLEPDELIDVLDAQGNVILKEAIVVRSTRDVVVYRGADWNHWDTSEANSSNKRSVERYGRRYRW